ncbi:MAG: phosphoglucosamine mutase, partial [Gammaproteobacteria bacterium]|nr:phosphoglucosamine mutase [Gammaproteobacteria bacterium]
GIKFFSAAGKKLPDEVEFAIEEEIASPFVTVEPGRLGYAKRLDDAAERYIAFCKTTVPAALTLKGIKLVVDCANGATYNIAPKVFSDLDAEVVAIGVSPDGLNINENCGSTHINALSEKVIETNADIGIALDGDGDRVLMVDHKGDEVDGDELLYIIARSRQQHDELRGSVVGTLMSNFGVEKAFAQAGIDFCRAAVGDRYVLAMLEERCGILGGESSGHIICLDKTTTGDGIVAALQVLNAVAHSGKRLDELRREITKYPQQLINVRVKEKFPLDESSAIQDAVASAERRLNDEGRVLLRPSGTEPLIRVMVEGSDTGLVTTLAQDLAAVVTAAAEEYKSS